MRRPAFASVVLALLAGPAPGLNIEVRYDYDTLGFFAQPEARLAMERVAGFYGGLLHDPLLAINAAEFGGGVTWTATFTHPATGTTASLTDLVVPADTLIVFVGGRNLGGTTTGRSGPGGWSASGSGAWLERVRGRGQAGAVTVPRTDFAPWGGQITFDLDPARTWHFQTDGRPLGTDTDFVSIALHEMGHLLGFGVCESWTGLVASGHFTGAAASASFGGPVPVTSTGSHWQDDGVCQYPDGYDPDNPLNVLSRTHGSFGRAHGLDQIALMDPSSCGISTHTMLQVCTDLDLAALRDIGWQLVPPPRFTTAEPGLALPSFAWPTTSGITYRLQRSTDLQAWDDLAGPAAGDGTLDSCTDPSPPAATAFYRLRADAPVAAPALRAASAGGPAVQTDAEPERLAPDCGHRAE